MGMSGIKKVGNAVGVRVRLMVAVAEGNEGGLIGAVAVGVFVGITVMDEDGEFVGVIVWLKEEDSEHGEVNETVRVGDEVACGVDVHDLVTYVVRVGDGVNVILFDGLAV